MKKKTVGSEMRRIREAEKVGLRAAAKVLRISPAYLSRIETGKETNPPSGVVLKRFALAFHVNLDELMRLSGRIPEDIRKALLKTGEFERFRNIWRLP